MKIISATRNYVAAAAEQVYDNPVLTMDFRARTRKSMAFTILGIYVLLMAAVLLIAYASIWAFRSSPVQMSNSLVLGRTLFQAMMWTQVILFSLIVPAIASGALSREIERRTMELLALTPLTSGRIVIGKSMSSFLYCIGLLISSAPLAGLCLMFGGISPAEVAISYGMLVVWVFLLSAISVFWSSMFRLTPSAVLMTYATVIGYFLLTFSVGGMAMQYHWYGGVTDLFILGGLNPGWTPYLATTTGSVCGITIPLALPPLALHSAMGTLLLLMATTHVQYHRTRRPLPIRLLLIGLMVTVIWLVIGNAHSWTSTLSPRYTLSMLQVMAGILLVLLSLIAVFFVTGSVRKREGQSMMRYSLSVRKMFEDDLGGATAFMLFWTLLTYGVFGLTAFWLSMVHTSPLHPDFWFWYVRIGYSMIAVIAGVCGIGILASSLLAKRVQAMLLVFLFLLVAFGGYLLVLPYQYWSGYKSAHPIFQLAAFWAMTPVLAVDWGSGMPKLRWSPELSWLVTGVSYLLFAGIAVTLAGIVHKRTGGVQEEV